MSQKVVCEELRVAKLCVKDGVWHRCVWNGMCDNVACDKGVCVCVNHLKRCKTSTFRSYFHDFEFFVLTSCRTSILNYTQGVVAGSRVYHQRRRSGFPGDTWPDQPCVPASFLGYGTWLTQRPPCRFQQTGFLFCTVFAIWTDGTVFSFFIGTWAASELTEPQARTKENRHQGYSPRIF